MSILSGEGFHAHSELYKESAEWISTVGNTAFSAVHGYSLETELSEVYYTHGKSREQQTYFLKSIEGPINRANLKG